MLLDAQEVDRTRRASGAAAPVAPLSGMRRWWVWLGALLVAAAAVVVLRRTVFAPDPVAVRVARIERGEVIASITNTKAGTVRARRRARLSPEISGLVAEIPHREGDTVEAGAVLLQLDDAFQRQELVAAERMLEVQVALHERACVETDRAQRELERNRGLEAQGIVTADTLDRLDSALQLSRASCQAARAEVARAQAAVEVARVTLDKAVVRAPFAGIVADVATEVGEWVTPAPPLVEIPGVIDLLDPASTYVSAPMDEVDCLRVRVGQEVRVVLDPLPGRTLIGSVTRVAPFVLDVEAQNRTVEIEVELSDPDVARTLPPGASADVEVVLERRADVLWVPTTALIEGQHVLLLDDGRLRRCRVEPGVRNWDRTEIAADPAAGIASGAAVVTSLERTGARDGASAVAEADGRP